MNTGHTAPADQLVAAMGRIYSRGLTTTSGGNLSVLDEEGNIWITPSGLDKGSLTRNQICCVRPDGAVAEGGKPSIELAFHQAIYRVRPDIRAILHAHPPALVAFSIAHAMPRPRLLAPAARICGRLGYADYAIPGSDRLGEYLAAEFQKGSDVVMMKNHGVCIGAHDMAAAYRQLETLEGLATIEGYAHRLGGAEALSEEEVSRYASLSRADKEPLPAAIGEEEAEARRRLVSFAGRACRQQLFTGSLGCLSLRLGDGTFLITPIEADCTSLDETELIRVEMAAEREKPLPVEVDMHARIYQQHPEIHCIIGACPVYSMAFAVTGAPLDLTLMPESYVQLRELRRISFHEGLADPKRIACLLSPEAPALLWENGQLIVVGNSLLQAFDRLEVVERTAQAIWMVQDIGEAVRLPEEELALF